jgi:hypothetical protein
MPYTPPEKQKRLAAYDETPLSIQNALSNDGPTVNFFLTLESEYKISTKLANPITEMGRDVLLGLLQPIGFDTYLRELVGPANADHIIKDFNEKVLAPLLSGRINTSQKIPAPVGNVLMHNKPVMPAAAQNSVPKPAGFSLKTPGQTPVIPSAPAAKEVAKNVTLLPMTPPVTQLPVKAFPPLRPLKISMAPTSERPKGSAVPPVPPVPPVAKAPASSPPAAPQVPTLTKTGIPSLSELLQKNQTPAPVHSPSAAVQKPVVSAPKPTGPTTPLVNKYVADPYREMADIDK